MAEWLFGTIREIPDMPEGTEAAVALDTDGDHALCIRETKTGRFGTHFNIAWLEHDEKTVDWLASMIGDRLQKAYINGRRDQEVDFLAELSGLKRLLKIV